MKDKIKVRVIEIAEYIIESKNTTRRTSKVFGISKSTIHKDMTERLLEVNPQLAAEIRIILNYNKSERHIRGGNATKAKFKSIEKFLI